MAFGTTEILLLILVIIAAFLLYKIFKKATSLAINAVLGVAVLIAAKYLIGLKIAIT